MFVHFNSIHNIFTILQTAILKASIANFSHRIYTSVLHWISGKYWPILNKTTKKCTFLIQTSFQIRRFKCTFCSFVCLVFFFITARLINWPICIWIDTDCMPYWPQTQTFHLKILNNFFSLFKWKINEQSAIVVRPGRGGKWK